MEAEAGKALTLLILVLLALRLGMMVHRRSRARQPIHGGMLSLSLNFLSGLCFVAILPTVCLSVLILHPPPAQLAGLTWHPLLLIVAGLGAGSLIFALLHALFERAPLERAQQEQAALAARGWTEEDARTSGL